MTRMIRKNRDLHKLDKFSPCLKCIIRAQCKKSFFDGSACENYFNYIKDKIEKVRKSKKNENKE